MSNTTETSDELILDLLRKQGPMGVAELSAATHVTFTAVRQRLTRLMSLGLIQREAARAGRGRPSHRYWLTEKGRRQTGANFVELSLVLWNEIREVRDPEVRRGLLQRIAHRMAGMYDGQITGATTAERMQSVADVFVERQVPFAVESAGELPVLTAWECPYPALAEHDRGICAVERMMISELVKHDVRLSECRLDGDNCCRFQTSAPVASNP